MALRVTLDLYTWASGHVDKNNTRPKIPCYLKEPYINCLLLLCACANHHECNNSDVTSTWCSAYVCIANWLCNKSFVTLWIGKPAVPLHYETPLLTNWCDRTITTWSRAIQSRLLAKPKTSSHAHQFRPRRHHVMGQKVHDCMQTRLTCKYEGRIYK